MKTGIIRLLSCMLCSLICAGANAAPVSRETLVGVWVGYTDGNEPPGWFIEFREDGRIFTFGRHLKKTRDNSWLLGVSDGVPDYRYIMNKPLLAPDGKIAGHLTSLFDGSKIPDYRKENFDYSEISKVEVVMEAHGGAFAMNLDLKSEYYAPDFWVANNTAVAINGHIFDTDIQDGILGLYPHRICPYDSKKFGPTPFPSCSDEKAINWQKASKPTFTWKRVEGELLEEYRIFKALALLKYAEVRKPTPRDIARNTDYKYRETFTQVLDAHPEIMNHPVAGPKLLAQSLALPVGNHEKHHDKMSILLQRGFDRWLNTKMPAEDVAHMPNKDQTYCDYFGLYGSKLNQAKAVYDKWCKAEANTVASSATPAKKVIADNTSKTPANKPAIKPVKEKAPPPLDWEIVGFWNYDGVDGQFVPQGLVLKNIPGEGMGKTWQWQLELKKHDALPKRQRMLWPVWINRTQKKICVNAPYPTYTGYIDLPEIEFDGTYEFASCKGGEI